MIAAQGHRGEQVGVLGLGRSGLSAARALAAGGAIPLCWDDTAAGRAIAEAEGFALRDLTQPSAYDDVSTLIVSPGVPHLYPKPHAAVAAALAAGVPVDNDIGLFFRSVATPEWDRMDQVPRIVAITGSNGKSTTSALLAHVLQSTGRPVQLAGNIGRGVMDLDPPGDRAIVVLELSSYQTELSRSLTPDIAVFTNLSPDHLDRHGGFGGYFAAKRRLFTEGGPDRAVIGVDEPEGAFLAGQLATAPSDDRVISVSAARRLAGSGWSVFVRKGHLAEYRKGRQVGSWDLRNIKGLPGAHNHQNACCAWAAARALALAPRDIGASFETYPGLPHRSQVLGEAQGVTFVNDSKATNADAAAKALGAFDKIRWICGGEQKEGGLEPVQKQLGAVLRAYVIGHQAEAFAAQLGAEVDIEVCHTMERAVRRAHEDAAPGDTVLLAPAAASFDQYKDFEQRGDDFAHWVAQRLRQNTAS